MGIVELITAVGASALLVTDSPLTGSIDLSCDGFSYQQGVGGRMDVQGFYFRRPVAKETHACRNACD
jgi:hypothetical protein